MRLSIRGENVGLVQTYRQWHGRSDRRREAAGWRLVGPMGWGLLRLSRGGGARRSWRRDRGLLLAGRGHVMLGRQLVLGVGVGLLVMVLLLMLLLLMMVLLHLLELLQVLELGVQC